MQPNQPQPEVPIDYLNSIASTPKQPVMKPWLLWVLIGSGVVAVIVVAMMLLSGGSSQSDKLKALVYRVEALQALTSSSDTTIQSSKLRTMSSSLGVALTNTDRDSAVPLAASGVKKLKKADKKSLVAQEFVQLETKLEDARLNVKFDRVYAREVAYQLEKIRVEMTTLYNKAKSTSLKSFLETADGNIEPLAKQFSAFSETQE